MKIAPYPVSLAPLTHHEAKQIAPAEHGASAPNVVWSRGFQGLSMQALLAGTALRPQLGVGTVAKPATLPELESATAAAEHLQTIFQTALASAAGVSPGNPAADFMTDMLQKQLEEQHPEARGPIEFVQLFFAGKELVEAWRDPDQRTALRLAFPIAHVVLGGLDAVGTVVPAVEHLPGLDVVSTVVRVGEILYKSVIAVPRAPPAT